MHVFLHAQVPASRAAPRPSVRCALAGACGAGKALRSRRGGPREGCGPPGILSGSPWKDHESRVVGKAARLTPLPGSPLRAQVADGPVFTSPACREAFRDQRAGLRAHAHTDTPLHPHPCPLALCMPLLHPHRPYPPRPFHSIPSQVPLSQERKHSCPNVRHHSPGGKR